MRVTGIVIFFKGFKQPSKSQCCSAKAASCQIPGAFSKMFWLRVCTRTPEAAGGAQAAVKQLAKEGLIPPTRLKDFFLEENGAKAREGLRTNEALDGGSAAAASCWLWSWHLSVHSMGGSALAARTPRWAAGAVE